MKKKNLFIIIGIISIVVILLLTLFLNHILNKGEDNNENIDENTNIMIIEEDIKKSNEQGIILTNLNNAFSTEEKNKISNFNYDFTLNNERKRLQFKDIVLDNGDKPSKIKMYLDNKEIDIMEIINNSIRRKPTSIIPKFYILGNKNDEVLLLEILTTDEELTSKIYISINNDGEIRNSFGGYSNDKITNAKFEKSIKEGKLIYDHRIDSKTKDEICRCNNQINNIKNIVLYETRIFTVSESSLKLQSSTEYKCSDYCK